MTKFLSLFSVILVGLTAVNAQAFDMSEICKQVAENFAAAQFQAQVTAPQIWVDQVEVDAANAYPNYSFLVRLSGRAGDLWQHQAWQITTSSLRGGCGVVNSSLVEASSNP